MTDLLQAGPDNAKAIIPDSLSGFAIAYLIPSPANNWQPGRIINLCGFPPVAYDKDNNAIKDIG